MTSDQRTTPRRAARPENRHHCGMDIRFESNSQGNGGFLYIDDYQLTGELPDYKLVRFIHYLNGGNDKTASDTVWKYYAPEEFRNEPGAN